MNRVGCLSDFRAYSTQLDSLDEAFDETMELYDWLTWLHGAEDKRIGKAAALLRVTGEVMEEIEAIAEEELYRMLLEIAKLPAESQQALLGVTLDAAVLTETAFHDMLFDMEYFNGQSEMYEEFLRALKDFSEN